MVLLSYFFMGVYSLVLVVLCAYGLHRYWILYLYDKYRSVDRSAGFLPLPISLPRITVQLPIYNELYVVSRLIESVCSLDYPRELLQIQVLDDSTDETQALARESVQAASQSGFDIQYLHRGARSGFKAGALAEALPQATGEFIAVFDADFTPQPDFLRQAIPCFTDSRVGMVQVRWGHLNADYSVLTRLQSIFLDGHFILEHTARNRSGAFFNFNGTAGIWRKEAIETSGGWQSDTLTEDLDLSYRAQMRGWRFVFLPWVVCPGELPVDIHSYRSQQYRWAKGSVQVAKKLLPGMLKADLPWTVKFDACAHLTSNLGYVLVVMLAVLFLPSLILRDVIIWPGMRYLELGAFISTAVSVGSFYALALREAYPDWRWRCRDLPLLMAFGVGMCVNNARAVLHALLEVPSGFERTAKFNIRSAGEPWHEKLYRNKGFSYGKFELALLVYVSATFLWAFQAHRWASLPFITFYLVGLTYIGFLSLSCRLGALFRSELPSQARAEAGSPS